MSADQQRIKELEAQVAERDTKITLLKTRIRESSGIIKLLYRGKHPNQIKICNAVLDQNTDAIK